jgi:putative colanic acid biosynthesis acetyltransferase WcaF
MTRSSNNLNNIPVIPLAAAPGARSTWGRPVWIVALWNIAELLFVSNPWQISSAIRVRVLRLFGATIGDRVIFRPRTRVTFPWKLTIGNDCWIGDGVWFHNQALILVGNDVVISQDTFLTTGSHAHRKDMALLTRPITLHDGVWITSRCMVLGGSQIGRSALVRPMSVVQGNLRPSTIYGGNPAVKFGPRFSTGEAEQS